MTLKLTIELVPSTAWNLSLYNLLPRNEWCNLKDKVFAQEGRACYICGKTEKALSLHEFWTYDASTHIQKLAEFHHLCNLCHKIKHIGFWCHTADGRAKLQQEGLTRNELIGHFCTVNGCTKDEFQQHERDAFAIWEKRSQYRWKQDFGEYSKYLKK